MKESAGSAFGRFVSWFPALLAAQLVLAAQAALAGGMGSGRAPAVQAAIVAAALLQGLLLLLRALPVLLLFSWPLLALRRPRARLLAGGLLWSLFVVLQVALDQYFRVAGAPLGADLFGYGLAEIATTLADGAGSAGVGALAAPVLPLLALWGVLLWRSRGEVSSPRWALAALLAGVAAWWLPLAPAWPALPDAAARTLAGNKLAWFGADTLRWLAPPAAPAPAPAASEVAAADPPAFDPHYPFLRPEQTPDTLGPFFAPTSGGGPPNLVVIVVEGLGRSFSGPQASLGSFTPFLDELAARSLYFDNFLANQGRTFGVLPSLLGSLPFAEQGFTALGERMPAHPGLFSVLRQQGYHTAYYGGTDTRFDNERAYLQLQGVETLVDLDGFGPGYARNPFSTWGYADRELVSRVLADSGRLRTPFALAIQTISMHTRYRFPGQEAYRARFEQRLQELAIPAARQPAYRADADIYSTILYSDDQLRRYFASVARAPWYADTVFVITGDHRLPEIAMDDHVDRYHVPLLIYSPLLRRPARIRAVSSHLDVAPSLTALFAHGYGLRRPAQVPWLGTGLDMSERFGNRHEIPLKQTKTSATEFLAGRWWLREGRLYELNDAMQATPVDDARLQAWVSRRLQRYDAANAAFLRDLALTPDGATPRLVAFDERTVAAQPTTPPPAPAAGIALESARLAKAGDAIEAVAVFANADPAASAAFVPLAVLAGEDGRDLAEAYGSALRLDAHERREVRLRLRRTGLAPGRYYVSVVPSDPADGRPVGRGRYHIPFDLGSGDGAGGVR